MSRLTEASDSLLVVIDVQERLLGAMPKGVRERVVGQTDILLTAATTLQVPVMATEQYPEGLGPTDNVIRSQIAAEAVLEKTCFSCADVEKFTQLLSSHQRKQVILTGMETHICVLQTALDLKNQGYEVYVVEDAVSSRAKGNQYNALQRLRQAGVVITNVESVLFEWLGDARHEDFKTLAKLIA